MVKLVILNIKTMMATLTLLLLRYACGYIYCRRRKYLFDVCRIVMTSVMLSSVANKSIKFITPKIAYYKTIFCTVLLSRVADLHSFNPDLDPDPDLDPAF
jgi:hypothetical protein